jgi:hypothetical protein
MMKRNPSLSVICLCIGFCLCLLTFAVVQFGCLGPFQGADEGDDRSQAEEQLLRGRLLDLSDLPGWRTKPVNTNVDQSDPLCGVNMSGRSELKAAALISFENISSGAAFVEELSTFKDGTLDALWADIVDKLNDCGGRMIRDRQGHSFRVSNFIPPRFPETSFVQQLHSTQAEVVFEFLLMRGHDSLLSLILVGPSQAMASPFNTEPLLEKALPKLGETFSGR